MTRSSGKKYEFTGETREAHGVTLQRIRALRDVGNGVLSGELGGWLHMERNLDHDGMAWVRDEAIVMNRAIVTGDARVCGDALVSGRARINGRARVTGNAVVFDQAYVTDDASVNHAAHVAENAMLCDNAYVLNRARVTGHVQVYGRTRIEDDASLTGWVEVRDASVLSGATVDGRGQVIVINGFFDDRVTIYRADAEPSGHVVVAGCQQFRLDWAVANLEELARRNEWTMPDGWRSVRQGLLVTVRGWQKLAGSQGG